MAGNVNSRQQQMRNSAEQIAVVARDRLASGEDTPNAGELCQAKCTLHFGKPIVVAKFGVLKPRVGRSWGLAGHTRIRFVTTVVTQSRDTPCDLSVMRHDHAAFARRDLLVGVERKDAS